MGNKHPNAKFYGKCTFCTIDRSTNKRVEITRWEYESHSLYELCDEMNAHARQEEISVGKPVFPADVLIRELK